MTAPTHLLAFLAGVAAGFGLAVTVGWIEERAERQGVARDQSPIRAREPWRAVQ